MCFKLSLFYYTELRQRRVQLLITSRSYLIESLVDSNICLTCICGVQKYYVIARIAKSLQI